MDEGEKKNKNLNFKSCFIIIFLFFLQKNFSCVENPNIQGMKGEVILYYYYIRNMYVVQTSQYIFLKAYSYVNEAPKNRHNIKDFR